MRVLAIESSAKAASVAVCEDEKLVSQYFQASGLTHSRTLLVMVEDILKNLDLKINDIDGIAVAHGPGSFTGIRIGISAAKGLSWGADIPVCGVSTLEAMAHHIDSPAGIICPVMDARRMQIYNAKFRRDDNGSLVRLTDDRAISIDQLIQESTDDGKPYFLLGDGAELCYNAFRAAGLIPHLAPIPIRLQTAWGVAMAALDKEFKSPDELLPNYLRLSQAERERLEKLNKSNSGG